MADVGLVALVLALLMWRRTSTTDAIDKDDEDEPVWLSPAFGVAGESSVSIGSPLSMDALPAAAAETAIGGVDDAILVWRCVDVFGSVEGRKRWLL